MEAFKNCLIEKNTKNTMDVSYNEYLGIINSTKKIEIINTIRESLDTS